MYKIFFENLTFVISFVYMAMKGREFAFKKKQMNVKLLNWFAPSVGGILSFLLMLHPMQYNHLFFDLRSAPIYMVSFIGGWRWGILAIPIPIIYRIYLGGSSIFVGILLSIILPFLIGILFNRGRSFKPAFEMIDIKGQMIGFFIYMLIRGGIGDSVFDVPFTFWMKFSIASTIFSAIILLIITLMINDFNRKNLLEIELEHLSQHDPMTSLPNRRQCRYRALKSIGKGVPVGLCMVDVDFFKKFNDTFGHQNGDSLLIELSKVLSSQIRLESDFVSRYGGEEFLLFCEGISQEDLLTIAERVRKTVEFYPFTIRDRQTDHSITISIGVSYSQGEKSLEQLVKEADIALYQSKRNGRNRVTLYSEITL